MTDFDWRDSVMTVDIITLQDVVKTFETMNIEIDGLQARDILADIREAVHQGYTLGAGLRLAMDTFRTLRGLYQTWPEAENLTDAFFAGLPELINDVPKGKYYRDFERAIIEANHYDVFIDSKFLKSQWKQIFADEVSDEYDQRMG